MAADLPNIRRIFLEALAKPTPAERRAYLEAACGDDAELLNELLAMLEAHERHATPPPDASTESTPTKELPPDEVFEHGAIVAGKYKILELISGGGMGHVYRAKQIDDIKREVALKVIKPGMDSRQVLARFNVERQALALMDHPNIAKIFDAGVTDQGRPFFVMELVKGLRLTQYCDEHKLSVRERLDLFTQVCAGVQHAHQKGILHRDLKPSNVLVGVYGEQAIPKIIDFGLAKAVNQPLTDDSVHTQFNAFVGTFLYSAPEQAQINNLDVDTRADVYSLGVILYELLTGKTPIEGTRLQKAAIDEVQRIIREEEPPKPSEKIRSSAELPSIAALRRVEPMGLRKLVRGDLDWIVMKALEKDRDRRYHSASHLADDVQHYLHDEPVDAGPPSLLYRVGKFMRRHRGTVLAASLIFLAILGGAIVSTIGWMAAHREKLRANEQAANAEETLRFIVDDIIGKLEPAPLRPDEEPFITNPSLKQTLDRLAVKVGKRFDSRPVIEARIRHVLGSTYLLIGDHIAARTQLQSAQRLRAENLGIDHADHLATLHELGWLHLAMGQTDDAQKALTDAWKGRGRALGGEHPDTLKTRYALGVLYEFQGKREDAIRTLGEVLEAQERVLTLRHPDTLQTQRELAGVHQSAENYQEAERLLREVLKEQTALQGAEHPETLVTLNNLAMLHEEKKEFVQADRLLAELIPVSERVFGPEHPRHLAFLVNVGTIHLRLNRNQAAGEHYQKLLPSLKRVVGPTHYHTLAAIQNYAVVLASLGKLVEAEQLLQDAYAGCRASLGDSHEKTVLVIDNIIDFYKLIMKDPEKEKHWREVLAKAKRET